MLVLGEVRTALLRNAAPVPGGTAVQLLDLLPGEPVRTSERPLAYALSPELTQGVDCVLPTGSGARVGAIGTVSSRAVITGGRVVQASASVRLSPGARGQRLPWSHYLARPGMAETTGKARWPDVSAGFLAPRSAASPGTLSLGAISERLLDSVQAGSELDGRQPFRSRRTRLRWAAWTGPVDGPGPQAEFVVEDELSRTLRLQVPGETVPDLMSLVEDLALHDWLLTALLRLVDRSGFGVRPEPAAVATVRPAIDHLLHLWMPGARVTTALQPVWAGLERRPGLSRQWQASVNRIRDQVAVSTVVLLSAVAKGSGADREPPGS